MANVLMIIPTTGSVNIQTSLVAAIISQRPDVEYAGVIGRPVEYVRNCAVKAFLKGDYTHLFFLDDDVEPPLDCLDKLLAVSAPLATGLYPIMMPSGIKWAAGYDHDGVCKLVDRIEGDHVDYAGGGCLLIRRDVLTTIEYPWFDWINHDDGSQTGEDVFFFRKCIAAGYKTRVCHDVVCNHYKTLNLTAFMRTKE